MHRWTLLWSPRLPKRKWTAHSELKGVYWRTLGLSHRLIEINPVWSVVSEHLEQTKAHLYGICYPADEACHCLLNVQMIYTILLCCPLLHCLQSLFLCVPVLILADWIAKGHVLCACLVIILDPESHNYDSYSTSNPSDSRAATRVPCVMREWDRLRYTWLGI